MCNLAALSSNTPELHELCKKIKTSPNSSSLSVISGFCHEVDENCGLLGCYAASSGNKTLPLLSA